MVIEIKRLTNNDDGSCNAEIYMDAEGTSFIVKYGIICALKDAINISKSEYTPKEDIVYQKSNDGQSTADEIQRDMMKEELKALRTLVEEQDKALRHALELNTRLQRLPLSDDRIHALYRRTMDWRQLARDIEEEHGVQHQPLDTSIIEENSYDE